MRNRKEMEVGSRLTLALALFLHGCAANPQTGIQTTETAPSPSASSTPRPTEVVATNIPPTETNTPLWIVEQPTSVPANTATPIKPNLVNPYEGRVFDQRCWVDTDINGAELNVKCEEDWAELPLPGGCPDKYKNFLGAATCNAAATTFVLNSLVPPEVFMRVLGKPGISPETLVFDVYPNLPNGMALDMTCDGAGVPHIRAVLEHFGLTVEETSLSEYTVADVVAELEPNQRLMVAVIGDRATRPGQSKHWTVASGVGINKLGNKTATYFDSFFYEDPLSTGEARHQETVILEHSPKYKDDPENFQTGKSFQYVGAFIVTAPDNFEAVTTPFEIPEGIPNIQMERVAIDPRFFYYPIHHEDGAGPRVMDSPVPVGGDKYRVSMRYDGATFPYYYDDPTHNGFALPPLDRQLYFAWKGLAIPMYSQFDPRWGGKFVERPNPYSGQYELFSRKGCGQTAVAALLGARPIDELGDDSNVQSPFDVYQQYFPNLTGGRGTFPKDYIPVFLDNDIEYRSITHSPYAVEKAVDEGKLVLIMGGVDFGWWGNNPTVDHFVLALGRGADGEIQIYDPYWGDPFTTKLSEVDFGRSTGVFTIDLTNSVK